MKSRVLTTTSFPNEAKTADNIRKELQQQLVSVLGFDASVMNCVVWDQGANYVAALRPYRCLDCQDHLYNTVLRHALNPDELSETIPEVAETLQATKALVRYLKQSGLTSRLSKTVKQMAETRFSTVFLTLKSIESVYSELQEILQSRSESQRLHDVSPDVLAFLVQFLRLFYDAQRELERDKYPTLNLVVPLASQAKTPLQPDSVKEAERDDIFQLAKRQIARFREEGTAVQGADQAAAASISVSAPVAAGHAAKKRALAEFEEEWENIVEQDEDDDDEVQQYLRLNHNMEGDGRDVLLWWKQHETLLPQLSRLARTVFSVPASSSSSERVFSAAGRVIEERRTTLKPSTVDAILFLHDAL
ncbi:Zinc finger BED domain-containing protein DAYSLEEPER [Anabarilius grahami]|uniref:Zinc finger BED domain-containing protein DAYSLEEPER n=1 Tax=Anabarilius grahami TaxID=495550 RepID=A0A3N0XYK4_ANAGA|nr:Zinc finger BED domain-containing protein DAYSLEEPER [Anabarilius grahami]